MGTTWSVSGRIGAMRSYFPRRSYGTSCGEVDSALSGPSDNRWITLINLQALSLFGHLSLLFESGVSKR